MTARVNFDGRPTMRGTVAGGRTDRGRRSDALANHVIAGEGFMERPGVAHGPSGLRGPVYSSLSTWMTYMPRARSWPSVEWRY